MSTEAERLAELVTDLGRRLAQTFGDVVSPEAQRHLRNAQREALTALFLIYEEQLGRRTGRTATAREEDDEGGWPRDMEEVIRRARAERDAGLDVDDDPPPRRSGSRGAEQSGPARPSRVKKIDLD